jgi:6-phosphofructokinase 1
LKLTTIGVVTSGGDAPGMNAAIRGIVRIAYIRNINVVGFERGWEGLLTNTNRLLTPRSVSGILHMGGTILHTSRNAEFKTPAGKKKAADTLRENNINALIVIGGNGSFQAALELSKLTDAAMIGIPASIDNDVYGTDETIGFDTAVNTAMVDIDKIRDTADSLERVFVIEVMGRKRGFIALSVGVAVGAEVILVPEIKQENDKIFRVIKENRERGKKSHLVVAAEGIGDTRQLAQDIEKATGAEARLSVLGYTQRGGNPTARSRLLASLYAEKAVELILKKQRDKVVVLKGDKITSISLEETCSNERPLDMNTLRLAGMLAT